VLTRWSKIVFHSNSVLPEDSLLQAGTLEKSHPDSLYYCPFGALFMRGFYPHYLVDFFPATIGYILFGRVLSLAGLRKDIIKLWGSQSIPVPSQQIHLVTLYRGSTPLQRWPMHLTRVPFRISLLARILRRQRKGVRVGAPTWNNRLYTRANTPKCLNVHVENWRCCCREGWSSVLHTNQQGTRILGRITRFFAVVLFSFTSPPSRTIRNRKSDMLHREKKDLERVLGESHWCSGGGERSGS
jgi:hypothetical protein